MPGRESGDTPAMFGLPDPSSQATSRRGFGGGLSDFQNLPTGQAPAPRTSAADFQSAGMAGTINVGVSGGEKMVGFSGGMHGSPVDGGANLGGGGVTTGGSIATWEQPGATLEQTQPIQDPDQRPTERQINNEAKRQAGPEEKKPSAKDPLGRDTKRQHKELAKWTREKYLEKKDDGAQGETQSTQPQGNEETPESSKPEGEKEESKSTTPKSDTTMPLDGPSREEAEAMGKARMRAFGMEPNENGIFVDPRLSRPDPNGEEVTPSGETKPSQGPDGLQHRLTPRDDEKAKLEPQGQRHDPLKGDPLTSRPTGDEVDTEPVEFDPMRSPGGSGL